jgi:hypothetical protein
VEVLRTSGFAESSLYGEKELGGLGVLSILTLPPGTYGLPDLPKDSTGRVTEQWASGVLAAGVAILLPAWFIVSRRKGGEG